MFTKAQLERYADVLLWGLSISRSGREKKNDIILIRYHQDAVRLAEVLYAKLLERGKHPIHRAAMTAAMEKSFYSLSDQRQLTARMPGEDSFYGGLNGGIYLNAPESITHLKDVNPASIGKAAIARKYLKDILDKRDEQGNFSWTLCIYPTAELASHAGLPLEAYAEQVKKACFLNRKDPVAHWEDIYRQAKAIKKWLNRLDIQTLHIESRDTDLEIRLGRQRKWIGISGHNIPSFEIFTSPDWRGTRGHYYADQPSYRNGNYVKGLRLSFEKGAVVDARAEEGEAFTRKQLGMDRGANKLGEFSLTDKRFSKINRFMANTLFDENFGGPYGNCHIALGSSYSNTYSGNAKTLTAAVKKRLGFNDSALHWDVVNTQKKRVQAHLANGKTVTIYENGKFLY